MSFRIAISEAASSILGRGLVNAQPKSDCCQFDEGKDLLRQLVVANGNPPAMLDAVEKALNS